MRCKNIDTLLLGAPGILCAWALRVYFSVGPRRDIWALQGYLVVDHCRDTLRLGSVKILCGWALQGYSAVGHCRDTWWLGTAGILGGWALQGYSAVRRCRDTMRLGTAGILCWWALQGYLGVGHCRDTLRLGTSVNHCRDIHWLGTAGIITWWLGTGDTWWLVTKVSFQSGEDNIYFKISQPHSEGGEQRIHFNCVFTHSCSVCLSCNTFFLCSWCLYFVRSEHASRAMPDKD